MSESKLPPQPPASTGAHGPIVVEMGGRRQVQLYQTRDGFYELALAGPTKPGSAWGDRLVVHAKFQLSEERVLETLAGIAEVCRRVDAFGLPGGEAADAA